VVLNWRAVCGECRACERGRPHLCFATHNATQKMTLADGTELSPALGIGAFAEKTLVAAGQCTKVDPDVDPAAAGLLGCGVMAGYGAAMTPARSARARASPCSAAAASAMPPSPRRSCAGATTIIAVDLDPRKLEWPRGSAPPTP
jgi:S-(hydroxymethyl)mycothiol dehydrogenase